VGVEQSRPRFGVAGWPVAHSRSPELHQAAYAELGVDAVYQRLPIPPELFDETVAALPGSGFRGINVTIPHKEAALALSDTADTAAGEIGAANTLTFTPQGIEAINTDAPALAQALAQTEDPGNDGPALVLGAGGTARAAAWALRSTGRQVSIWNRTAGRASELAESLGANAIERLPDSLGGWEIVVNCTSLGMRADDQAPCGESSLRGVRVVVDFVYAQQRTTLARMAQEAGCRTIEGPELLARQGALSFAHWFGVEPPLAVMLAAIT
jgi:shikimate dehydrogenase